MQYPTTKQLQFLIMLDTHKHFGKAAKACFISQSAFSIAIKALEEKLGTQLVDRTNKRIIFTEYGRNIVRQARLCLNELDTLMSLASDSQQPLSGKLTLGVIPTISPFILPETLPAIQKDFPSLQLYLREDKTLSVYEQLMEGKVDVILIALPYPLKGVEEMVLFDDAFMLAYHQHSQWIKDANKSFKIENLAEESLLLLDDGHCLRDHALEACSIRDTAQVSRFSGTSLQTLLQMVAADLGVTFIPKMAKPSLMAQSTNIQLLDLPKSMHRQIGLVWRKGSARENEFKILGEYLIKIHHQASQIDSYDTDVKLSH